MTRNHDALTRVWAAKLGPRGVTVNAVAPGLVDIAMLRTATARMGEEAVKAMVARTPPGRLGTTSPVADVVAFLARRSLGYRASARHDWRIGPLNGK